MRLAGPDRRWIGIAGLASALTLIPVAPAWACTDGLPGCASKKSEAGSNGRAIGPVVNDSAPREPPEVAKRIQCAKARQTPKHCPDPVVEPEPETPSASQPPAPTPAVRPQPAAVPMAALRQASPPAPSRPQPAAPDSSPDVRVLRVPVFMVDEEVAAAVSAAVGLAAAVAVLLAWWLPARRRRRREIASEYGKLTSTFIANLSHELFTPLTPVKGYASMLQHSALPPTDVQRFAGEMAGASDRLQRVLDSMVALAELNVGAEARPDVVDTAAVVHQAVARVPASSLHTIEVEIADDVPSLRANERLLGLAVEALVDNAVKFSPDGGPVVVEVGLVGDREVRISVTDEGVGMTAVELQAAHEAFRQGDPSSTRRFGGLGLGLALADRVARLHGGRLEITSKPGHGTKCVLSIPLSATESSAPETALEAVKA